MELYSSENSDSDEDASVRKIDFSYNLLDSPMLYQNIEDMCDTGDKVNKPVNITKFSANHNFLTYVPENIFKLCHLRKIDLSNNRISCLPEELCGLPLKELIMKNNNLNDFSLPKSLERLGCTLENLNLSGNLLTVFPHQIFRLVKLKYLFLGQNRIEEVPYNIHLLKNLNLLCNRLEILSLGGNALREVPASLCKLHDLEALILSDNELESLPVCIANLKKLRVLQLHRNKLKTLPTEIVTLKYLAELSLRDNPLVVKFVSDMIYDPPTLQEISARIIKLHEIAYAPHELPKNLVEYLSSAHHCLNPNCKGVYFDNRVEHIKFVDFCGKYRVPLLQYLCSLSCIHTTNESEEGLIPTSSRNDLMRKVLLG